MCTTTGIGEAVSRGFAGMSCGPPASSTSRSEPAMAGTTTRAISANGTHPIDPVGPGRPSGAVPAWMVIWRRPGRAGS